MKIVLLITWKGFYILMNNKTYIIEASMMMSSTGDEVEQATDISQVGEKQIISHLTNMWTR